MRNVSPRQGIIFKEKMISFVKGAPFTVCMESSEPPALQNCKDISDCIVFVNIRKTDRSPVIRMNTQQTDYPGKFSVQSEGTILSVTFLPELTAALERGCYKFDIIVYDPDIRQILSSVFFRIYLR